MINTQKTKKITDVHDLQIVNIQCSLLEIAVDFMM